MNILGSKQPKAVIAADDATSLHEIEAVLRKNGYDVKPFQNGADALNHIMTNPNPSCLLFDYKLPGMDGLEICKKLNEVDFRHNMHICILGKNGDAKHAPDAFEAGADDFLVRPLNSKELVSRLKSATRRIGYIQTIENRLLEMKDNLHGRYQLKKLLGEGGISDVYEGWDTALARRVAIKSIKAGKNINYLAHEEMWREARITASLNHPNIVIVHDCWANKQGCFVVMELINGISLEDYIETRPVSPLLFENITRQCLQGLVAAHEAGVLHCDLKPSNIMLLGDPTNNPSGITVKVLDFGVAHLVQEIHPGFFQGVDAVRASPLFVAPEFCSLENLDQRSDLYSLGHILYNALTGVPAIEGRTIDDILDAHMRGRFAPLAEQCPDLSHPVCAWVERLMKRDADQRPPNSKEALNDFLSIMFSEKNPDLDIL